MDALEITSQNNTGPVLCLSSCGIENMDGGLAYYTRGGMHHSHTTQSYRRGTHCQWPMAAGRYLHSRQLITAAVLATSSSRGVDEDSHWDSSMDGQLDTGTIL